MVALAAIVVQVAGSAQTGKADARLSAGLETALGVYSDDQDEAEAEARRAAADPAVAAAIRSGAPKEVEAAARSFLEGSDLVSLEVLDAGGRRLAAVGAAEPLAEAELELRQGGEPSGQLIASVTTATEFVRRVKEITGRNATVSDAQGTVATTIPVGEVALPAAGGAETVELGGEELRAVSAGLGPDELRLTLFGAIESGGFAATRPLVATALAAFFLIALGFVVVLLRSLQSQIQTMLAAARRIGSGDFSQKLPVEGNDEIADLAREFNSMSDRLAAQMGELRRQRTELEQSVRRIGEAFASGLDRSALLEIVAETAISACEADHARILLAGSQEPEVAVGEPLSTEGLEAVRAAERDALRAGSMAEAREGDVFAISHPLATAADGADGSRREGRATALSGAAMTIVRRGRDFDREQREVLRYLIGQAAASIENVELHELVAEQAVTDELTGLPNNRRFRRWITTEVARAERFGSDLSLLMLDIDDFKKVNDTHGHLQGDEVLRQVGRVLREESRGIDEPARYGGEEFAIGLPETDIDGAVEFAERVRERIATTEVPMVDGEGSMKVTTSVGAATVAEAGRDPRALVDAADQALYRAKRSGKNRTERAAAVKPAGEGKRGRTAKIRSDG
jgi:diguanylate cyclase (GGDEF)-like protein